jgi:hypothetical protein
MRPETPPRSGGDVAYQYEEANIMNARMKRAATLALVGALTCGVAISAGGAYAGPGKSGNNGANGVGPGANGNAGANNDKGEIAAAAGGLNAAKASPTARANAAKNSRVGLIAAFEEERLGLIATRDMAAQTVNNLEAELSALESAKEVLDDEASYTAQEIDAANATLSQYGVTYGQALDDRIAALPGAIDTAKGAVSTAQAALDDPVAQIASLEPAANKDVTMEVVEAAKGWLGLSE